jgi:hypothetical protein
VSVIGFFAQHFSSGVHRIKKSVTIPGNLGARASKNKQGCQPAECLNRFDGRWTVIAMASEFEPRVF